MDFVISRWGERSAQHDTPFFCSGIPEQEPGFSNDPIIILSSSRGQSDFHSLPPLVLAKSLELPLSPAFSHQMRQFANVILCSRAEPVKGRVSASPASWLIFSEACLQHDLVDASLPSAGFQSHAAVVPVGEGTSKRQHTGNVGCNQWIKGCARKQKP